MRGIIHLFRREVHGIMQETIIKIKAATAIIQNMVSTEDDVKYNDLALFFVAKMLYESIDELEDYIGNTSQK